MHVSIEGLERIITSRVLESENLEFKEALTDFSFEKLLKYCVALANERGGKLILGVTDKFPRNAVGTESFRDVNETKLKLLQKLHSRIEIQECDYYKKRILVFHIPSRPLGVPQQCDGCYWMRSGESLVPMTPDVLRKIMLEVENDFSEEICLGASLEHLDPVAIEALRMSWFKKSSNQAILSLSIERLLSDVELVGNGGITYAALILLGKPEALHRFLPQAELVFEYRSNETSGPAHQRIEFQQGFFSSFDELWKAINLRNDIQHFQDGFFIWDIPTFNEQVIREAVLNAVAHRDYHLKGSVFVRQFPRKIEIQSPGGFPIGITSENILWNQNPRNRRIADVFVKCGLVDRAGQGVNLMFEKSIQQGKSRPDFNHSDSSQVFLTLEGSIQDPNFLRFLEKVGKETSYVFSTEDFLVLDLVHRQQDISSELLLRTGKLVSEGILEKSGRGRGVRYFLSQRYYDFIGKQGAYTREKGLDRTTNKELLLTHIKRREKVGSRLNELTQVLPSQSLIQVQKLLQELKLDGKICKKGTTRAALWYPVPIMPK